MTVRQRNEIALEIRQKLSKIIDYADSVENCLVSVKEKLTKGNLSYEDRESLIKQCEAVLNNG